MTRGFASYLSIVAFATVPLYHTLLGMLAVGALVVVAFTPGGTRP